MSSNDLDSLASAVHEGDLVGTENSIKRLNRSYPPPWSEGYDLLSYAIANKHREIAIKLLQIGCKVNSNDDRRKRNSDTPLHAAIKNYDIELVKWLLARNANVNVRNQDGATCLDLAAKEKLASIHDILSNHERYVNSINLNGKIYHQHYTLIHYAVEEANEEKIKALMENDRCADSRDLYGKTPLHIAAEAGYLRIVEYLLKNEASIDSVCTTRFNRRYTPLHFAVSEGNAEMVKFLLSEGADVDGKATQMTPLYIATETGNEEIVKLLLEHGADVNAREKNGKTILYVAYENGNLPVIDLIVKSRPDDLRADDDAKNSERRCGGLHAAAKNWNLEIAVRFITDGADVNAKDKNERTPLSYAIDSAVSKKRDLSLIELLLTNGARVRGCPEFLHTAVAKASEELLDIYFKSNVDIHIDTLDRYGRTALHVASKHRNSRLLEILRKNGAEIDCKDSNGKTALHFACEKFFTVNSEVIEALLRHGADIRATDENGKTALHFACENGTCDSVEILIRHGADINAREENGRTPLHFACQNGHSNFCTILLRSGADAHARDENDSTPLHYACEQRNPEVVKILVNHHVDINSRDKNGVTALHMAAESCRDKVVEILLNNGADINSRDGSGVTALLRIPDDTYSLHAASRATAQFFYEHIMKMTIANMYVSEHNFRLNFDTHKANGYKLEVEKMKREKILDHNITFYDILRRGRNRVAMYTRNESVVEAFKLGDYKRKFPLYSNMLRNNFEQGMNREVLLNFGVKSFHSFVYELPEVLIVDIFEFLDTVALENFVRTYPEDFGADLRPRKPRLAIDRSKCS